MNSKKNKIVVVVESPTKVKALNKYLGNQYETIATIGHIKDLPINELGVNIEKSFEPHYVVIEGKEKIIKQLQSTTAGKEVFIATDPDREGEAIAWHVSKVIEKKATKYARIEFEEITKTAVLKAIQNPRAIDYHRVNAQQARRVLDRLVGYLVSPLLWRTVKTGISAGRVQSVALRLLCEREEEILSFVPEEYWTIHGDFLVDQQMVGTKLVQWDCIKSDRYLAEQVNEIVEYCQHQVGTVISLETKTVRKNPPPPFTTSTLQQAASSKLGFGVRRTMSIAQQLYEGVDLPEEGPVGLITYMRTDSVRLADEAVQSIRNEIVKLFGKEYIPENIRQYKNKGEAQDAHEAIRPTDVRRHPEQIKDALTGEQYKLYDLIWRRTVACQMEAARFERQSADIQVREKAIFRANGQRLLFDGYLKLYGRDDEEENGGLLPKGLEQGIQIPLDQVTPSQHFTEPPSRFTEANLVKDLDELGIGRPSTYATIIQTLFDREYITRIDKKLQPTPLGKVVNQLLVREFPELFNVEFTAQMEAELDAIEAGKGKWQKVVEELYKPLQAKLNVVQKKVKELKDQAFIETDETCPNGHPKMQLRISKFGAYLRCPECQAIKKINENGSSLPKENAEDLTIEPCELCGSSMVLRTSRFGSFYGCSNYPKCKNVRKITSSTSSDSTSSNSNGKENGISLTMEEVGLEGCPECGSPMTAKKGRFGVFFSCTRFPTCRGIVNVKRTMDGSYTVATQNKPSKSQQVQTKTSSTKKNASKTTKEQKNVSKRKKKK
ncbi:MAG: type I DNA topoisomerase [bacterium]|nr:type I DNA topoisomerase [bacterium]